MSYEKPYAGLKVIDLSQGLAAPYVGMLLAQHGADVIKVEPPAGDWSRILNQNYGDHTAFSVAANLGKRSIALDLKHPKGKEILWRLLADADVMIEGFRPGVLARLGFGYAEVAQRAPRIIYLSISGFGPEHPLKAKAAMDPVLQAYTGLVSANRGEDGTPQRIPVSIVDMSTSLYAVHAVSAALFARQTAPEPSGRHVEVSLLEASASLVAVRLLATWLDGENAPVSTPPSGSFEAADGWLQVQVIQETDWQALCTVLGASELAFDERYNHRNLRNRRAKELREEMRPLFKRLTLAELSDRLGAADILFERLNTYGDFVEQESKTGSSTLRWLHQPGVPRDLPMPRIPGLPITAHEAALVAPSCGEHTMAILAQCGYGERDIEEMRLSGAVGKANKG
ncbi:MAG: CoA transferase [Ottowia sp.]|uniref:CaiB/BaiF CoA transferase family protein n=1 Tax=Ottowia sp. TaxID=1898956 RepID=UPI003C76F4FB